MLRTAPFTRGRAPFGAASHAKPRSRFSIAVGRALAGAAIACFLFGNETMAAEEPSFKTIVHEGAFEVRDYPSLVVAEVTVGGNRWQAASAGFRLLAGYIFGGNRQRRSIAMTVPVEQVPAGEKIAMTAPVTQAPSGDGWIVRFIMPREYTLETLPEPDDPRVHLRELPAARLAVLRFSGLARERAVEAKTSELEALVAAHHLRALGSASLAQYDPPWTLWFMRRNEAMISVAH